MDSPKEFAGICDYCGRYGEKAARHNLKGITLLSPDDKWICDSCLNYKKKNIAVSS